MNPMAPDLRLDSSMVFVLFAHKSSRSSYQRPPDGTDGNSDGSCNR